MRQAIVAGGLIGLAILVWLTLGADPAPELGNTTKSAAEAEREAPEQATAARDPRPPTDQASRTDISTPTDGPPPAAHTPLGMGRIEGTVRFHNRQPATDTPVFLQAISSMAIGQVSAVARTKLRSVRTDRDGQFRYDAVRPGNYALRTPRGESTYARVEPGKTCSVRLTFDAGVTATVMVLGSDGRPIEGAEVLTNEHLHPEATHVAARTDATGAAQLPDLQRWVRVSARAKGFTPSDFRLISADVGKSVDITFRLQPGGATVRGQVLDVDGSPVVGAAVDVRRKGKVSYTESEDGRPTWLSAPIQTTTDETGSFELMTADGPLMIRARAESTGVARQEVDAILGQTTHLVLRLPRAAKVTGIIRTASGRPAANVRVRAQPSDWFERSEAKTDKDGAYELHDVVDGTIELQARRATKPFAQTERTLAPGQEIQWSPVFTRGLRLIGRVVSPDVQPPGSSANGTKAPRYRIMVLHDNQHVATTQTDRVGKFSVPVRSNEAHTVIVQRELIVQGRRAGSITLARKPDVHPTPHEVLIDVPGGTQTGRLTATLTTRGDRPLPKATLLAHMVPGNAFVSIDANRNEPIEVDGLPAGTYFVQARAPGFTPIQAMQRKLEPGGLLALGEIVFESGFVLEAKLTTTARPTVGEARITVFSSTNHMVDSRRVRSVEFRTQPLEPGKYRVTVAAAGLATTSHSFEIVDQNVAATIELPDGVTQAVRCRLDGAPTPRPKTLSWSLFRVGERSIVDSGWTRDTSPDGAFQFEFAAAAGRYRLYAGCEQAGQPRYHGNLEFDLNRSENRPRELLLRPRKPR